MRWIIDSIMIIAVLAVLDLPAGYGCPIEVDCDLQRRIIVAARDQNHQITVAVEIVFGWYGVGDRDVLLTKSQSMVGQCSELEPELRYSCPECLVFEEFQRRKAGEIQARAQMFEPGYSRTRSVERIKVDAETLRGHHEPFDKVYLLGKMVWDSYTIITFVMASEGNGPSVPWTLYLKKVNDRYWLTEEITLNSFVQALIGVLMDPNWDVVEALPEMRRTLRVSMDMESPPDRRKERVEEATTNQIDPHSLIVYINDHPTGHGAPLLQLDVDELSPVGHALRDTLAVYANKDATREEMLHRWYSDARPSVGRNLDLLAEQGHPLGSRLPFTVGRYDSFKLLTEVRTPDGVVCYGYGRGFRPSSSDSFVTIVQRYEDGEWRLANALPNRMAQGILTHEVIKQYFSSLKNDE